MNSRAKVSLVMNANRQQIKKIEQGELTMSNTSQTSRKLSSLPIGIILALTLANCNESGGPTSPTADLSLPTAETSTSTVSTPTEASTPAVSSLADKVVGTFIGMLGHPVSGMHDNYRIKVTKINDTRVQISAFEGSVSSTFRVDLLEESVGMLSSIRFQSPDDILANNGSFTFATGSLAYGYFLGGSDDSNVEVFYGTKE